MVLVDYFVVQLFNGLVCICGDISLIRPVSGCFGQFCDSYHRSRVPSLTDKMVRAVNGYLCTRLTNR